MSCSPYYAGTDLMPYIKRKLWHDAIPYFLLHSFGKQLKHVLDNRYREREYNLVSVIAKSNEKWEIRLNHGYNEPNFL